MGKNKSGSHVRIIRSTLGKRFDEKFAIDLFFCFVISKGSRKTVFFIAKYPCLLYFVAMALHDITLTHGSNVVVFRNWRSADLPRSRQIFVNESSYSTSGNLIKSGASFELPYIWTIVADLYQADYDKIQAIWEALDYYRRIGSTTNGLLFVTVDDESEEIFEWGVTPSTKKRSAVAGTTPRELNGGTYYYARFLTDMVAPPIFGRWGVSAATGARVCPVSLVLQGTSVKI